MELIKDDKYHFISENPSIYILTSRLEALFKAIDEERNAIYQMGNLIASIPPRLFIKHNIKELINERNEQLNILTNNLNIEINTSQFNTWSNSHKDQYIQQQIKDFNIETYQSLANKVTAIIDELYIHEEERKEYEEKLKEESQTVKGILS